MRLALAVGVAAALLLSCGQPTVVVTRLEAIPGLSPLLEGKVPFRCEDGCAPNAATPELFVRIARRYAEGVTLEPAVDRGCSVRVTPEDALASEAVLDDGRVVFASARAGQHVVWVGAGASAEEWTLVEDSTEELRYRLSFGPSAQQAVVTAGGALELRDGDGRACLRANAPFVIDARGMRREAAFALSGDELSIRWSSNGLTAPIAVDPTWTTTGSLSIPRSDSAIVNLNDGRVMVGGGTNGGGAVVATTEIYDPATGNWTTSASSMTVARQAPAMTLLSSGLVLASGGQSTGTSGETWDPSTGLWTAAANSMSASRYGHISTLLGDGTVLLLSGGNLTNVAELFNPSTRTFSATPTTTNVSRSGASAVRLQDGRVLIVGGKDSASTVTATTEIYNPVAKTFTAANPLTTGARQNAGLTVLPNGNVLMYGGLGISGALPTVVKTTELWNAATGVWATAGSMNSARYGHSGALLPDGKVLAANGLSAALGGSPMKTTELFTGSAWANTGQTASSSSGHNAQVSIMLRNGRVLVAGGQDTGSSYTVVTELYDPSVPALSSYGATLSVGREYPATAVLPSRKVLIAGGFDSASSTTLNSAQVVDPAGPTLANTANAMLEARQYAVAVTLTNGKVLIIGGANGATTSQTSELYDPATNSFGSLATMTAKRSRHTATLLPSGKVLVTGGCDGATCPPAGELYDPSTNSWTATPPMVQARYTHAAILLRTGKVLIFGGTQPGSAPYYTQSELYDPATNQFTATGNMVGGRQLPTVAMLEDGRVLAAGGFDGVTLGTAELYNPTSGTWASTGGALNTARTGAIAALLRDGRVLIVGGAGGLPVSQSEFYDPTRGVFVNSANMVSGRYRAFTAPLPDGRLLVGAGYDGTSSLKTLEVQDLGFGTVASVKPVPTFASTYSAGSTNTVTGTKFRGAGEGSGGNFQLNAASDHPLLHLVRLDNGDSRYLPTRAASETSLTFDLPAGYAAGYVRAEVVSNGVHSDEGLFLVPGTGGGSTVTQVKFTAAPTSGSAGACIGPFTLQLQDAANAPATSTLPTDVSLSSTQGTGAFFSDAGCGSGIASVTIAAGSSNSAAIYYRQTLAASATLTGASTGLSSATTNVTITAASASTFVVTGFAASVSAGTSAPLTVTAKDAFGNTVTNFAGTVTFTSSDAAATLPAALVFNGSEGGTKISANATLRTVGTQNFTATSGSVSGTHANITVTAASASTFIVTGFAASVSAGTSSPLTVTARDAFGNTVTNFAGTVTFTSSDATATLPAALVFNGSEGGTKISANATLRTVGTQNFTATSGSISGTHANITVTAAAASTFVVTGFAASVIAGTSAPLTVTAKDAFGNTVTNFAGTVTFSSSDAAATLPAALVFNGSEGGTKTSGNATLRTVGTQNFTATSGSVSGTHANITVTAASASTFVLTGFAASVAAGTSAPLTVTAKDGFGNTVTNFAGTVTFTSSDPAATLPAALVFNGSEGGTKTSATATLRTIGTQNFTATSGSVSGTHANITVTAASASTFVVTGFAASVSAGTSAPLTVTAKDGFGNTVTNFAGTVTFTSTDAAATLPVALVFNGTENGTKTSANATLRTAGTQNFTATSGAASGTHANITVTAGSASSLLVTGFAASVPAGTSAPLTVTAKDGFGNTVTNFAGTVTFTSTDAAATIPAALVFNGSEGGTKTSANATLRTVGTQNFTATNGSVTGTHANITVTAASASNFVVTGFAASVTAGTSAPLTVTAKDGFGNTVTNFAGTVTFTSNDPAATLPSALLFNGTEGGTASSGPATLRTLGTRTFTATSGAATGTHANITVTAGAAAQLLVTGFPTSVSAGTSNPLTVTAADAFGNTITNFVGTVTFTSTDAAASLPSPLVFTGSEGGTATSTPGTLRTVGTQSFTASSGSLSGAHSPISVTAGAASSLVVAGYPSTTIAGVPHPVTVTLLDSFGNAASGYVGTVSLSSDDSAATPPPAYTFTPADNGMHTFSAALATAGVHSLSASDGSLTGTQTNITVTPATAARLVIQNLPSTVNAGAVNDFSVRAEDAFGNQATSYVGTVRFLSTDSAATLPVNAAFTSGDQGLRPFAGELRFFTAGTQSLTVEDTTDPTIRGTQTNITVLASGPPVIVHDANLVAAVGVPYRYNALATVKASGAAPITYDRCAGPQGFSVDPQTGAVQWLPTSAGTESLCVKATNALGSDLYNFDVVVSARTATAVVAQFTATPSSGPAALTVQFDASPSSADPSAMPLMFAWSFGDGTPLVSGVAPTHTYVLAGGYQATLTAYDAFGDSGSASKPITVLDAAGHRPPTAKIVATALRGPAPLASNFRCDCVEGDAPITAYEWDFGDGASDGNATADHLFAAGRWTVTLTVVDANGLTAIDSVELVATDNGREPPQCTAGANPTAGSAPLDVNFSATASGDIATQRWSFSATDAVNAATAQRRYDVPGRYRASFIATDTAGLTCQKRVLVTVTDGTGVVPPLIVTRANPQAHCGQPWSYAPAAAGSAPFQWSITGTPNGLQQDAAGAITWTPTRADSGDHTIAVSVSNPAGSASEEVTVQVECEAPAPLKVGCACSEANALAMLPLLFALRLLRSRRRRIT